MRAVLCAAWQSPDLICIITIYQSPFFVIGRLPRINFVNARNDSFFIFRQGLLNFQAA
ncbi:MAG: hypothetical protein IKN18_05795 [Neisseriaceae bacterium]|nr:hypothetical protein [Neisseriaceae bacterium]